MSLAAAATATCRRRLRSAGVSSSKRSWIQRGLVVGSSTQSQHCSYHRSTSWCSGSSSNTPTQDEDPHALYKEQMEELKAEREELYGFTDGDHAGWANALNHKHSSSFLDELKMAREAAERQHDHEEESTNNPILDGTGDAHHHHHHHHQAHDATTNTTTTTTTTRQATTAVDTVSEYARMLTHLSHNGTGTSIHMVDVGEKEVTKRIAVAESRVVFPVEAWEALTENATAAASAVNNHQEGELVGPKGPILNTAKVAGIMAAKKTSDLIPLCHPLPLSSVNVNITLDKATRTAVIRCDCKVTHKTGVEMEALTGASVAALTIYDMCKAVSHEIQIEGTRLIQKSGGKRRVNKDNHDWMNNT